MKYTTVDSPLGPLLLARSAIGLTGVYLPEHRHGTDPGPGWLPDAGAFADVTDQLQAYWAGDLQCFALPLDLQGTAFQRAVWTALLAIPYGRTTSYGAIAAALQVPGASRAVGLANGKNPVSIVVPCHRVVGSTGLLTGYGGGLPAKRFLLAHEAQHSPAPAGTLF